MGLAKRIYEETGNKRQKRKITGGGGEGTSSVNRTLKLTYPEAGKHQFGGQAAQATRIRNTEREKKSL